MRLSYRWAPWILALAALDACSDDGLATAADTDFGKESAGDGGTGSVSTTATVSAGQTGDPGTGSGADDGVDPSHDGDDTRGDTTAATSPGDSSGGDEETGGDTEDPPPLLPNACRSDRDCVVIDDCCTCSAAHVDDTVRGCAEDCDTSSCIAAGLEGITAQCVFGSCELVPVGCSPYLISCDAPPPMCPDGMLPSIDEEAGCWTGHCVPSEACDVVPDCTWCEADEACISASGWFPWIFCSPVPQACTDEPDCECMGEVCTGPFQCAPSPKGNDSALSCVCPSC